MWVLKAVEMVVEYSMIKPMEGMYAVFEAIEGEKEKTNKELMAELLDQVKELNEKIDKENS